MAEAAEAPASSDDKIVCHIDNARVHSVQRHIKDNHPDWTVERYKKEFPDAPLLSERAQQALDQRRKTLADENAKSAAAAVTSSANVVVKRQFLHDVFGLGTASAAMSSSGKPIEITTMSGYDEVALPYVATVDPNYVFNIDLVKTVIVALELNKPLYLWGYHGTGKTTILEQVAARTGRPFMRVQHTVNTEESHILGQFLVRNAEVVEEEIDAEGKHHEVKRHKTVTDFQLGPLPMAMLYGFIYCADEYDFAMPQVTSVYQPVLEGKPLVIKEAPPEFRVIRPHPNFRFVATGNTNGVGDESGLYQGTFIGNAANYSRFGVTEEVQYMDPRIEESVLVSQASIGREHAKKIVRFANGVRERFKDGQISMTVSPRELINAANLGIAFQGDWMRGMRLAFTNRLSRVDKKAVEEFGQRIFDNAA